MRQRSQRKERPSSLSLRRTVGSIDWDLTYQHNNTIAILSPGVHGCFIKLFYLFQIFIPHLIGRLVLDCGWSQRNDTISTVSQRTTIIAPGATLGVFE